jgi:hypothetical protein
MSSPADSAAKAPRLSYTNRARIILALTPILFPLSMVWSAIYALGPAAKSWWWHAGFKDEARDWYRSVYRVARYGSVRDV